MLYEQKNKELENNQKILGYTTKPIDNDLRQRVKKLLEQLKKYQ